MPTQKDGIDNVVVNLDRKEAVFRVGETMTGNIVVICNETTAVRGVRLKILGRMNIHWKEVSFLDGLIVEFEQVSIHAAQ